MSCTGRCDKPENSVNTGEIKRNFKIVVRSSYINRIVIYSLPLKQHPILISEPDDVREARRKCKYGRH